MLRIEADGLKKNIFLQLKIRTGNYRHAAAYQDYYTYYHDDSPLAAFSLAEIAEANGEIIVVIEGSDDILSQNVFDRTSFAANEIIADSRFEDSTYTDKDNILNINIRKTNQYISAPQ